MDPRALDTLRAIDHSAARIADALEELVKIVDELATVQAATREREPLDVTHTG